jgi:hypothetical protein
MSCITCHSPQPEHGALGNPAWLRCVVGIYLLVCMASAAAAAPGLRLSGFGTLGLVYGDKQMHLQRDLGQPDVFHGRVSPWVDSLLGLQVDAAISPSVEAAVQLVAKKRAEQSFSESLGWAFLRWRPNAAWDVRAGRLGLDLYMLSDYRDVSFAYLWQRPPPEFYAPLITSNFDGVDLTYRHWLGDGSLRVKVFGGVSRRAFKLNRRGANSDFELQPLVGLKLAFEDERWRLSAGIGHGRIGKELNETASLVSGLAAVDPMVWPQAPDLASSLGAKSRWMTFYSIGGAYDDNRWVLQAELGYLDSDWRGIADLTGGYLSIGRHVGNLTPYVLLAAADSNASPTTVTAPLASGDPIVDATLQQLYVGATGIARGVLVRQQTASLGLRWDVRQDAAIKLQWDHSWVARGHGGLWWRVDEMPLDHDQQVDIFSASLSFVF